MAVCQMNGKSLAAGAPSWEERIYGFFGRNQLNLSRQPCRSLWWFKDGVSPADCNLLKAKGKKTEAGINCRVAPYGPVF
jgi:hypothetical protein